MSLLTIGRALPGRCIRYHSKRQQYLKNWELWSLETLDSADNDTCMSTYKIRMSTVIVMALVIKSRKVLYLDLWNIVYDAGLSLKCSYFFIPLCRGTDSLHFHHYLAAAFSVFVLDSGERLLALSLVWIIFDWLFYPLFSSFVRTFSARLIPVWICLR